MFADIFVELVAFLVILLAILLVLFFLRAKNKKASSTNTNKKSSPKMPKKEPKLDFASIIKKIESKTTSTKELKENLELILEYYGEIDNFSSYEEVLIAITLHPNTSKNVILHFDKELSKRNPEYKKRISDVVTDALKSR